MIPAILALSAILILVIVLLVRTRSRVVSIADGGSDGAGNEYRCIICGSARVRVSEAHERCEACGYSTEETYSGTCREHMDLLRDIDGAITHFETACRQLGGSDPNLQTYAAELTRGTVLLSGGAPVVYALQALKEDELAERMKQLVTAEGGHESRAERFAELLALARNVLSQDVQQRLREGEGEPR